MLNLVHYADATLHTRSVYKMADNSIKGVATPFCRITCCLDQEKIEFKRTSPKWQVHSLLFRFITSTVSGRKQLGT